MHSSIIISSKSFEIYRNWGDIRYISVIKRPVVKSHFLRKSPLILIIYKYLKYFGPYYPSDLKIKIIVADCNVFRGQAQARP